MGCLSAHPRVGGENRQQHNRVLPQLGSSPRGRGKLLQRERKQGRHGLIPAWAGKTTRTPCQACRVRAHPRVGGENGGGTGRLPLELGLIPAWAGKTLTMTFRLDRLGAHPRVGGENAAGVIGTFVAGGSSPRGRGKPPGNPIRSDTCAAHPRVGGENGAFPGCQAGCKGLIPAWAGKTSNSRRAQSKPSAHPRVGGENYVDVVPSMKGFGSSPRGRGKPDRGFAGIQPGRLIPAWAGKTR